jgi:hypothetical protein
VCGAEAGKSSKMSRCFVISGGRWSCESRRSEAQRGKNADAENMMDFFGGEREPLGKSRRCLKVAL